MKILRVVHGLSNNLLDLEVPDEFNLVQWRNSVIAEHGVISLNGMPTWIPLQWVQHVVVMSAETASEAYRGGASVQ